MAKTGYAALAPRLLERVGGEDNISAMNHCATRLRFVLKDVSKAATEGIKALDGVVTVVQAGGQYQVVIGNDVPILYEELTRLLPGLGADSGESGPKERRNPLDAFIGLVSAIFSPMLWTLAGTGLFKAFLAMFLTFGWISDTSDTYKVLYAAADAFMNFLPLVLAVTAARHFKTNQFTAMAIAGALVYPSIIAMNDGHSHTFMGIPLVIMSYTSSVLPIIVAVWVQGYVERCCNRFIPSSFRNFMTPWITVLIMVPLTLLTIGPVTTIIANGIASGVQWLFVTVPVVGGIVIGGFWQVFVMFGLHWGLVPIMTQEITSNGYSLIYGPIEAAVLAQAASTLAVMIRTRDKKTKELAGPAALSGFLAGITEPGIYGVNLPLKRPFVYGCVGGAVGGALMALAGSATDIYVFPSIVGFPALLKHGDVAMAFIGIGVAVLISLALTLTLGFTEPDKATGQKAPGADVPAEPTTALTAPVAGTATPLEKVADPVFSSGALGNGVGIVPSDGHVRAPVAGTVVTAMDSGHAYGIRTDDGVEVLVHVGLDTVNLKGEGFSPRVGAGQRVDRGDPLVDVDLAAVRQAGYDPTTVLVVTNTASLGAVVPVVDGPVTTATTVVEIDH